MDMKVIPSKYVEKIKETKAFPGNEHMVLRIGLQGHINLKPNVSYIRPVFDVLGATKMPIWLTELDTKRGLGQVAQLEDVMRAVFSHPAVEGIILWGGWKPTACNERCLNDTNYDDVLPHGCTEMCLMDSNFKNGPLGDIVDKLLKESKTTNVIGNTDEEGIFEQKVFHGEYSLTYSHPLIPRTIERKFSVTNDKGTLHLYVTL
ncbi:hypothetical protein BUALT_Bualt15G0066600 [Buddleja alternifolia]|uniref:GH10 domain-containing protein n=1 Tax=Buddleja alternifolia TaxID=168488 RepID=A0AAV6WNS5_9LAMI|nr:hypothetical protein BUALT_Bualt15G0066600 [Buddleja alternifolia]